MERKLLSEIEQMKYMFGYKRGVVLSEQKVINEKIEISDEDTLENFESKVEYMGDGEGKRKLKALIACCKENNAGLKVLLSAAQTIGAGVMTALSATFFLPLSIGPAAGTVYAGVQTGKAVDDVVECYKSKMGENTFIPPDSEPSPDQMQDMM